MIASWWGDVQYDIKTLAFHGFHGVVQGWLTTIEAAFADDEGDSRDKQKREAEKRRVREHRMVPILLPDYLTAMEEAEARRVDIDAQVKATASPDGEDDTSESDSAELKSLRANLASTKRHLKRLEKEFQERLKRAVGELDANSERDLVLHVAFSDLKDRLDAEVTAGRRMVLARYRTWADKYMSTLPELEARRAVTIRRLDAYLKELGYV